MKVDAFLVIEKGPYESTHCDVTKGWVFVSSGGRRRETFNLSYC